MCVCQKIVWSIEFNPALRESPTKTVRASRERGERERWQRQRREEKSEQEREREREQRERQTERERERATREQREQRRRRERRAEPILSCVLYVSLARANQLPTLSVSYHLSPMPVAFRPTLCTPPALQYVAREETDRAKVCHQGKRKRVVPGRTPHLAARAMVVDGSVSP